MHSDLTIQLANDRIAELRAAAVPRSQRRRFHQRPVVAAMILTRWPRRSN